MRTLEERFWSKVNKTDSCWLWTKKLDKGYGRFQIDGSSHSAHKVSYELHFKESSKRKIIKWTCGNKHCVNPDHFIVKDSGDLSRNQTVMIPQHGLGFNCLAGNGWQGLISMVILSFQLIGKDPLLLVMLPVT